MAQMNAVVTQVAAANCLPDPSFETAVSGWTPPSGTTVAQSAEQARTGTKSMKITWGATTGWVTKTFTLPAAGTYDFSAWVWLPVGSTYTPQLNILNNPYADYPTSLFSTYAYRFMAPQGAWYLLGHTFVNPVGTRLDVKIGYHDTTAPAGQSLYVDDLAAVRSVRIEPDGEIFNPGQYMPWLRAYPPAEVASGLTLAVNDRVTIETRNPYPPLITGKIT